MKMLFKQRFFSWLDSYDIYAEDGSTLFTVKGVLSWGHCLKIFDADGNELGRVQEEILTFLVPKFHMYLGENQIGTIRKEFTFFKPKFTLDMNGWEVDGDWFEWDYEVHENGRHVATVSKELFNWTDTYAIDVDRDEDALSVLMIVLAIDAAKCSAEK
ncbi:MAG: LURP-one-related family protein [Clostridia bacterium]|nr:LURP-one-related family protein [Clostridia bacterium]